MPLYYFESDKTGEIFEREFSMKDAPWSIRVNGETCYQNLTLKGVAVPSTRGWPQECIASGVNASQAGELRDHFKKRGLDIPVSNDGNPIYPDAKTRRKGLKCRGLVDKSSFY